MNVPIDISSTVLHTERLTLRPWRESDVDDFYEYASVDGVGQNAGWLPHESIDKSREILQKFIEGKKVFALEYEGKAVGSLGVEKYDEEAFPEYARLRCRELGFVLAKPLWGRGLMAEAVMRVCRWLFEQQGLDAIFCGNFVFNTQSARVQEKCGFKPVGRVKHETRYGAVYDTDIRVLNYRDFLMGSYRRTQETHRDDWAKYNAQLNALRMIHIYNYNDYRDALLKVKPAACYFQLVSTDKYEEVDPHAAFADRTQQIVHEADTSCWLGTMTAELCRLHVYRIVDSSLFDYLLGFEPSWLYEDDPVDPDAEPVTDLPEFGCDDIAFFNADMEPIFVTVTHESMVWMLPELC